MLRFLLSSQYLLTNTNDLLILNLFHCNNVTFGAGVKSSQSKNHMRTNIHNFTLVSLASTVTPHPAGLSFRATVPSHLMHSTTYSTPYCLHDRKRFPAVRTICALPTCRGMRLSFLKRHQMAQSLSGRLDAIKFALLLYRCQLRHRYWSRFTGQMTRAHLFIGTSQDCWLDDEKAPLRCHQINDGGLTLASHHYARVIARWLEVLASYAGRPNLTVITSRMVLERLGAWQFTVSSKQVISWETLIYRTYWYEKMTRDEEDDNV